jgi:hypothetical protein
MQSNKQHKTFKLLQSLRRLYFHKENDKLVWSVRYDYLIIALGSRFWDKQEHLLPLLRNAVDHGVKAVLVDESANFSGLKSMSNLIHTPLGSM